MTESATTTASLAGKYLTFALGAALLVPLLVPQLPYKTPAGNVYDSGDFASLFEETLVAADWDGFVARKTESRARGRLRGRGISNFLETSAPLAKELGGFRFQADGTVLMVSGTLDYGQGHHTAFAQVLADKLGIDHTRLTYRYAGRDFRLTDVHGEVVHKIIA